MATVREILTEALEIIGVYAAEQTPSSTDIDTALKSFTQLREQWSNERLFHPTQVIQTFAWGSGVASKTIGAAGNFVTSYGKPHAIEHAFIRDSNSNDYQLRLITNLDYEDLVIKAQQSTLPGFLRYDMGSTNATGTLYLWPVPSQSLTLGIASIQNLLVYAVDDTFTDPTGYQEAITYNLAIRLCVKFGLPVPQGIKDLAAEAKTTIKRTNLDMEEMDLPAGYGGQGRYWDFHSGFWA